MKFVIDKNEQYTSYKYNFYNLTDLYDYLKSNPKANSEIFEFEASIKADGYLCGEPFETAVEYLKGGYKVDFDRFAFEIKKLEVDGYEDDSVKKIEIVPHGGVYLSPLVAAGIPNCMIRYSADADVKRVTIYFQLAYPNQTTTEQIFNRGVATINLIQSLEKSGYLVDLKVFNLVYCGNEFIDVNINLKNTDECLNLSKCYYPLVGREFLRRLLFRVMECSPVKNCWGSSYGRAAQEREIRKFYNLRDNDLVIQSPGLVGINGEDIYDDTLNLFTELNLSDRFDLSGLNQKVKRR